MKKSKQTKLVVVNGIIAAVYIALSVLVFPVASGAIQFRISECLNHLVVFNKRLMWGVLGGVLIFNLMMSTPMDVLFGGGQTFLCLAIMVLLEKFIPDIKIRLALNTILFTLSMALIAWMILITAPEPVAFWPTYATTALGEFVVMAASAPLMYYIDSRIHFAKQV